jgi:MoxR-like ATPase
MRLAWADVIRYNLVGTAMTDLTGAQQVVQRLRSRLRRAVIGRDETIDLVIVALLADGHVLLEDYPGSGKTTLAKALGDSLIDDQPVDQIVALRRIQFTPDLLPGDVTGTTVFDPNSNRFFFRPGPIFAHVVLADEINRTSPKVQSALLEAMAEKQVTVDNKTYKLDDLFFVIATQNPLDLAGTFPLPQAQLDRFLFKIRMNHIDRESELRLLDSLDAGSPRTSEDLPKITRSDVVHARKAIAGGVFVHRAIRECLVDIAAETRAHERSLQGVSTRSLVLILPALQALALIQGRDHVTSDDVARLAPYVFGHRLTVTPGSGGPEVILGACLKRPIEKLSRSTLRR